MEAPVSKMRHRAMRCPSEGGTRLEFVRTPKGKKVRNRSLRGCDAGTLDELANEIARLRALQMTIA